MDSQSVRVFNYKVTIAILHATEITLNVADPEMIE